MGKRTGYIALKVRPPMLPAGIISSFSNFVTGEDDRGWHDGTVYPLQYIQADGTGYFTHSALTATCTCPTKNGTSTPGFATAGRMTLTSGTLWSFTILFDDSYVGRYEFATLLDSTHAVAFDVNSEGRNLVAVGFTMATMCASGMTNGSDYLNQHGYTVSDGISYYQSAISFGLIPDDVIIPLRADGLGCCAYEVKV